jgi:predicted dehydrogenase
MAMNVTSEQRELGKANFQRVVGQLGDPALQPQLKGLNRRDFMKGLLAAGGAALPISAAVYFGYESARALGKPVKAGLIGAGDEGGVLVGEHNPAYLEFIAYSDIRPSNQKRIFEGEAPPSPRKGFNRIYGKDAAKAIKLYADYKELLADDDIEAVVIALPLHLHAQVTIEALDRGKHVLCEKLMAWNITQCKEMIAAAKRNDRVLSIGHQRHYSLLYAHAVELLASGVIGDFSHIRALWHRNNSVKDSWRPDIKPEDRKELENTIKQHGYKSLEELVRWRLYNRTGGGLMAELGSHQLDACSIFLTANAKRKYPDLEFGDFKLQPLAVQGVGGKHFYRDEREVDDHVYVTFEFPGDDYYEFYTDAQGQLHKRVKDPHDLVVVTYSSINTNANEPYGECVMGTKGTLIVEKEQEAMLYPEAGAASRSTAVGVATGGGGAPVLDSSASVGGPAAAGVAIGQKSVGHGPVSRGYREEMEHFAYLIRMRDQGSAADREKLKPRCDGKAAMADALMALTSNLAMKRKQRIEFDPEWFDPESAKVPDADVLPEMV